MKELQEKIEKFNEERDWDQFHSPENLANCFRQNGKDSKKISSRKSKRKKHKV